MIGLLQIISIILLQAGPSAGEIRKLNRNCKKSFDASWKLLNLGKPIKNCISNSRNRNKKLFLQMEDLRRRGKTSSALKLAKKALKSKKKIPLVRLSAAKLYWIAGKKELSAGLVDRIIDDYQRKFIGKQPWELYAAGEAAILKRDWVNAEEIFTKIDKKHGKFAPGLVSAGKYNRIIEFYQRSKRLLKKAVKLNPMSPRALVEYGKSLFLSPYGEKMGKARELALNAVALNPVYFHSYILLAKIALNDLDYKTVFKNIKTVEKYYPDYFEILTIKAGVAILKENTALFKKIEKSIKKKFPLHFNHYYQLGRILNRHHRYTIAAREFKKGIMVAPDNAPLLAWLGLSLLRTGDEKMGFYFIKKASEANEDHVMAYNIMTLFQDTIFPKYISVRKGPFLYRVPKKEWDIMKLIVPPVLEAAFKRYQKHYNYTPPLPVKIEFFKDKKDFMVLVAGHPVESGILGVCFGKVISFLSPSSGKANWAMVISHELAHTFHVEQTRGRVPRWFTEGLAEFETAHASYYWKREMSRRIYSALKEDKLKSVANVNRSFTHARSNLEMVTAYIYSTWLLRYIFLKGGWKGITRAIIKYRDGGNTADAMKAATGYSVKEFDKKFKRYIALTLSIYDGQFHPSSVNYHTLKKLKEKAKNPKKPVANCRLAYRLYGISSVFSKSYRTKCMASLPNNPYLLLMEAYDFQRKRNFKKAKEKLKKLIKTGNDGYEIRILLSKLENRMGNREKELDNLKIANKLDPEALHPIQRLSFLYHKMNEDLGALYWLRKFSRYAESDSSSAAKIVEIAWKLKKYKLVADFGSLLVEIHPFEAGINNYRTGYALMKTGHPKLAYIPLSIYRKLNPSDPLGKVRLLLSKALIALGRKKEAKVLLKQLKHLFPGMIQADKLLKKVK
jgi:tetratricopeptide (TPR) repeat protein